MTRDRLPLVVSGLMIVLLAGSGLAVVYPSFKEMHRINLEMVSLQNQAKQAETRAKVTESLADELNRWTRRLEEELKPVPDSPDMAGLIRELGRAFSDHGDETSQTITTGDVQQGEDSMLLPIIVESKGSFENVFNLIHRIEGLDRLIRVRRVTIKQDDREPQLVDATLQIDAYFADPNEDEAGDTDR